MDESKRKFLSARISDLFSETERGYVTFSAFLDPAELFFAKEYIKQIGASERTFFFGGYKDAERQCAFFLPEYYVNLIENINDAAEVQSVIGEELGSALKALKICGSGYRRLSHRDYLGAILNMGIERSAIGDVCITDESSCVLFASPAVADLIGSGCERIGSDKVKIKAVPLSAGFTYERKTKEISDTVASDRLDCVVASLAGESREKAKTLILSGLVECNYSPCTRTDLRIVNGDTVTIRGIGKFIVSDITEGTKKGRLRLSAKKYV